MSRISESGLEKSLWKTTEKLRKNIETSEFKHLVLGLIFLKYISDSFEETYREIENGEGVYGMSDPEDRDEYIAKAAFYVPQEARWSYLRKNANQVGIGGLIDSAMDAIEAENPMLKDVLPKVYGRDNLDRNSLKGLIYAVSNIEMGDVRSSHEDMLGNVFEYFLGEFDQAAGKQGGQFYTPRSLVELLVTMLEPYKGSVYDPCCGSGGMFIQSEKFVKEHQGKIDDITIYGQESNQTTWKLTKMNLEIRGIDSSQVKWNNEGSFLKDAHPDLKADYIMANPPFAGRDWWDSKLTSDKRWLYGIPPKRSSDYAWIQHIVSHMSPTGKAAIILGNNSLSNKIGSEHKIRRSMIQDGNIVECIVDLPAGLFTNTEIPVSLWFLNLGRKNGHLRRKEILFINARNLGELVDRRRKSLTVEDIRTISDTYHMWIKGEESYKDVKGFCASAPLKKVYELDCVLTPIRYVGVADIYIDKIDFRKCFTELITEFEAQLAEEESINRNLIEMLRNVN